MPSPEELKKIGKLEKMLRNKEREQDQKGQDKTSPNISTEELKDRLEERVVKLEQKEKPNYVFEPVFWDNCPLDKLLIEVKAAVANDVVPEEKARPYMWKLAAGERPAFPGWTY